MTEPTVIADERDLMQAALHLMRDAFAEACQLVGDWKKQGEFQGRFFDGYAEAKHVWGLALIKRDVLGKTQEPLADSANITLTRRSPSDRLRYLSAKLQAGEPPLFVAMSLEAMAMELEDTGERTRP